MDQPLSAVDVRVIGSLIEKEVTTPDNYPLTLNALVAACNQSSNRDPVLSLEEPAVKSSLDDLARRALVGAVHKSDSRVLRYRQRFSETLKLHPAETAIMCVLMLRGPQTTGEIRTRTARLHEFRDLQHVDVTLQSLMTLTTPLVVQLPRRPGQKEVRYAHLLSGEPVDESREVVREEVVRESPLDLLREAPRTTPGHVSNAPGPLDNDRIAALEQTVESLRAELTELRAQLEEFRREFQ